MLGFGALLTALNQDALDIESIEWRSLLPFVNKQDKIPHPLDSGAEGMDPKEKEEILKQGKMIDEAIAKAEREKEDDEV